MLSVSVVGALVLLFELLVEVVEFLGEDSGQLASDTMSEVSEEDVGDESLGVLGSVAELEL